MAIDIPDNTLFFGDQLITTAILDCFIVSGVALILAAGIYLIQRWCFEKYKERTEKYALKFSLKVFTIAALCLAGFFLGYLLNVISNFTTARDRGLQPDKNNDYKLTLNEILYFNEHSFSDSNVNVASLQNTAIIFVRYDCLDCIILHDDIENIENLDDFIILSSRTDKGREVIEEYDIQLTQVPCGVYINTNGKAMTVEITGQGNDNITIDSNRVEYLRSMIKD